MYLPDHFAETDSAALHALIAAHPLGTLISHGPDGLTADHLPFLLDPRAGDHGTLIGHVARGNPLWREHDSARDVLVVFQGPSAPISPSWYPTKQQTHEVVPTYNYAVVHAHGRLIVHHDPKWLRAAVGRLTKAMEARQPRPWRMAEAPPAYLDRMLENIVGLEIPLARLVGKFKLSQNRVLHDRSGAIHGLRARGLGDDLEVADMVEARLPPPD